MKIGYLGAGTWGFALAALLAKNGHQVTVWARDPAFADQLQKTRVHPKLPGIEAPEEILFTNDLKKAMDHVKSVEADNVAGKVSVGIFYQVEEPTFEEELYK